MFFAVVFDILPESTQREMGLCLGEADPMARKFRMKWPCVRIRTLMIMVAFAGILMGGSIERENYHNWVEEDCQERRYLLDLSRCQEDADECLSKAAKGVPYSPMVSSWEWQAGVDMYAAGSYEAEAARHRRKKEEFQRRLTVGVLLVAWRRLLEVSR